MLSLLLSYIFQTVFKHDASGHAPPDLSSPNLNPAVSGWAVFLSTSQRNTCGPLKNSGSAVSSKKLCEEEEDRKRIFPRGLSDINQRPILTDVHTCLYNPPPPLYVHTESLCKTVMAPQGQDRTWHRNAGGEGGWRQGTHVAASAAPQLVEIQKQFEFLKPDLPVNHETTRRLCEMWLWRIYHKIGKYNNWRLTFLIWWCVFLTEKTHRINTCRCFSIMENLCFIFVYVSPVRVQYKGSYCISRERERERRVLCMDEDIIEISVIWEWGGGGLLNYAVSISPFREDRSISHAKTINPEDRQRYHGNTDYVPWSEAPVFMLAQTRAHTQRQWLVNETEQGLTHTHSHTLISQLFYSLNVLNSADWSVSLHVDSLLQRLTSGQRPSVCLPPPPPGWVCVKK